MCLSMVFERNERCFIRHFSLLLNLFRKYVTFRKFHMVIFKYLSKIWQETFPGKGDGERFRTNCKSQVTNRKPKAVKELLIQIFTHVYKYIIFHQITSLEESSILSYHKTHINTCHKILLRHSFLLKDPGQLVWPKIQRIICYARIGRIYQS